MSQKTELIKELKKLEVIEERPVILTSGRTSDYYCDIKKAFGNPKILRLIADLMVDEPLLKKTTSIATLGYGGMSLGAIMSLKTGKRLSLIRETQKKHGTEKQIEGYVPTESDKVLIVDDVLTTGKSLMFAQKIIEDKTGAEVIGAIVVIKRENPELNIEISHLLEIDDIK